MNLYTLFDKKTTAYGEIIQNEHLAEVIRMFVKLLKNPETKIAAFPEDYALYQIGQYDMATGRLEPAHQPIFLMEIATLLQQPSQMKGAQNAPVSQT